MHICIDARISRGSWLTGVGKYTTCLLNEMANLAPTNTYTVLVHPTAGPIPVPEPSRFRVVPSPAKVGALGQHLWMPKQIKDLGADVVLHTHPGTVGLFPRRPSVAIVLDVYPLRFPQYYTLRARLAYKLAIPLALRRAVRCIAISHCTKQDMTLYLGVRPDRVDVTHLAVSKDYAPVPQGGYLDSVLNRYGIARPYVLYHGNKRPHKNVEGLVRSYYQMARSTDIPHHLVITGLERSSEPEFDTTNLRRVIAECDINDRVHFTGLIAERDLPAIYSGAHLLAMPSFFEGFGLPAIESMACGTPVVASKSGSLPEVTGDAGVLVDPHDLRGLADAMERVIKDDDLRRNLSRAGRRQARSFSWHKTARLTLAILEAAAQASLKQGTAGSSAPAKAASR